MTDKWVDAMDELERHFGRPVRIRKLLEKPVIEEPDLTLPPIPTDDLPLTPEEEAAIKPLVTGPIPAGVFLNYSPLTCRSVLHRYPAVPLAEGECGECGVPVAEETVSIEIKPDGCCFSVQCKKCGADNVLAIYTAYRVNPNGKKGA